MYKEDGKIVEKAIFKGRPNRFLVDIEINGKVVRGHMPNPGRMWELLFPGVTMYVVATPQNKTPYRVVGIERDGAPILLDTHYCNEVAALLIETKAIEGWEEYHVVRREVKMGHSRFDLLLVNESGDEFYVEVKSCTLFGKTGAMFPDAITERGRRHLEELALLNEGKLVVDGKRLPPMKAGFLILVHWGRAKWFLPDYHTDLNFSKTFLEVSDRLDWRAVALEWDEEFSKPTVKGRCHFPKDILEKECDDKGDYVVVLHLAEDKELSIGSNGVMSFKAGYYMYVGSAKANLTKRLERHQRKRKNNHWHLDYFRNECDWVTALPVRSSEDLECVMAKALSAVAVDYVVGFGCSDCRCKSHLFRMDENPVHNEAFMMMIEDMRMNRLDEKAQIWL